MSWHDPIRSDILTNSSVSVVIRALNEADHIGELLSRLAEQSTRPDEIVLVDSGSSDGTVRIAEQFGVNVIHMPPSEFTFGRSLNWGCEEAKGQILIFVSAHVYPLERDWLEKLVAPFEDDRVGLSYGGQTGDHRSNFAELRVLARWFPEDGTLDQTEPFCNNANCAVRRSLWEEIGYNESLPGLEDIAFAREVRSRGHRLAYVPDAKIAHVHEEGPKQIFNRYRREAMAYKTIFDRREIHLGSALTLISRSIVGDARAAIGKRRFADILPAAAFRIAQFSGAWVGYRARDADSRQIVKRMYYPR